MNKLLLLILSSFLLGGCTVKNFFVQPPAGLEVNTTPPATVYLDNNNVGVTPYSNKNLKAGSYLLKLAPTDTTLAPYETQLDLVSGTSTVISRNLVAADIDASGYSLQLTETSSDNTFISLISDPDMVSINIDGTPSGFTPISKLSISPGSHSLSVSSPGYVSQELSVSTVKGYNLVVNLKLASSTLTLTPPPTSSPSSSLAPSPSPSNSPSPSPLVTLPKPYVVVGTTETGWLRVRADATGSSDELGKVNTGEQLKYLGVTTDQGWHKVEFEGQPGYVSAKYVTLVK